MEIKDIISLKGKVALITGGSSGIGAATSTLLAEAGSHVFINYHLHKDRADQLVRKIRADGGVADCIQADVTKIDELESAIMNIRDRAGGIDILVNNAGIVRDKTMSKMEHHHWHEVIDVNLNGAYNPTRLVLPGMLKKLSGKIVFVSSIIAQKGGIGQSNYSASKAGMIGMMKSLALEMASKNIQVNCVAPGFTNTAMLDSIPETIRDAIVQQIPMRRIAEPIEVARVILFLVSSMSDMITGQVIAINGGHYM